MKIILITGGLFSIPSIHHLAGRQLLHSIVSLGDVNKNNVPIEFNAQYLNVPFKRFQKDEIKTKLLNWISDAGVDAVLVFGCRYKMPADLLCIPPLGFYNVHFSLLPAYRGNAPMFWQIKNGEQQGGITIHRMAEDFDTGPMLVQHQTNIDPAENHGLLSARLSMESVALIEKAIDRLQNGNTETLPQTESRATYFKPPVIDDLKIDWEQQSATEIECVVNAANPDYVGAVTLFRGQPFRVLEVNRVQMPSPQSALPGTVVYADINYGVVVACKDEQFIRINIAQLNEGIFSGFKLVTLGIALGERFENPTNLQGVAID
ncbi:methionyl-tRNA formyltransferase [Mucilaginibacter yixingensis]|uniref:Methionyl-tRNA formyltransferase n=1 Tax=Mucilaginibacter yixingensis TaxID=1295612 RepID=A0A2T5JG68_9SPHI|nr:formyltransferase family protein [Mucilaginibacter yixingensis]PTR01418.1 methionyl-tRNA formyltransferase [Mucilaginibacter yixingensis]